MRVFITGVAGFLGSHLADRMLSKGYLVSGCDNLLGGERANVPDGVCFTDIDCREIDSLKGQLRNHDLVYHCAATAYEGLSVFSPFLVAENVYSASVAVFSAAISAGVNRIVYCSSMARYGCQETPFQEDFEPRPQDPYGIAKVAAETTLRNLAEVHAFEYSIAVPHNIIGPRQKYDDPFRNVAAIMINRMLQGKQPIIYGDGEQRRCFSFVDDCIECLDVMGECDDVVGHVVNIGPDSPFITINQLAEHIAEILGFDLDPMYVSPRPQEVRNATCSADKARRLLGYKPAISLRDGLLSMIDYMQARGPRPFKYHLPIEIETTNTPVTWRNNVF